MKVESLLTIQRCFPQFNKAPLSLDQSKQQAQELGLTLIPNPIIPYGSIEVYDNQPYLFYNQTLSNFILNLVIQHEIGHYLLGHCDHKYVLHATAPELAHLADDTFEMSAIMYSHMALIPNGYLSWQFDHETHALIGPVDILHYPAEMRALPATQFTAIKYERLRVAHLFTKAIKYQCRTGLHDCRKCHIWQRYFS